MPSFHPIGFWIPAVIASIFLFKAFSYVGNNKLPTLAIIASGIITYLFPIPNSNGVGLWPFYLVPIIVFSLYWIGSHTHPHSRFPMLPLFSLGFFSLAIPDYFITMERYGSDGTVGGHGWHDGLIYYWLYAAIIGFIFSIASEIFYSIDNKKYTFSFIKSATFNSLFFKK